MSDPALPATITKLWEIDPENCCSAVKVGQLDRALAGKALKAAVS